MTMTMNVWTAIQISRQNWKNRFCQDSRQFKFRAKTYDSNFAPKFRTFERVTREVLIWRNWSTIKREHQLVKTSYFFYIRVPFKRTIETNIILSLIQIEELWETILKLSLLLGLEQKQRRNEMKWNEKKAMETRSSARGGGDSSKKWRKPVVKMWAVRPNVFIKSSPIFPKVTQM